MRRLDLAFMDGGLYSQPYIFAREMQTVIDAEIEHSEIVAANIRLALEYQKNGQNNSDNQESS